MSVTTEFVEKKETENENKKINKKTMNEFNFLFFQIPTRKKNTASKNYSHTCQFYSLNLGQPAILLVFTLYAVIIAKYKTNSNVRVYAMC